MSGDPLGDPHKLIFDLACGHESSHSEAKVVAGSTVCEQIERDLIIRLSEDLLVTPGWPPNVARDHVTNGLEVANIQLLVLLWGRSAPILIVVEVESGESGKTLLPSSTGGVHGEDDVVIMFEKRNTVSGAESGVPPLDVFLA